MKPLWIRVARVALIFTLAGWIAGYIIAAREPGLSQWQYMSHPWAFKAAGAAFLGSLPWMPLLSWPRLWSIRPLDEQGARRERGRVRVIGLVAVVLGLLSCLQTWVQIDDNGVARLEIGDNAEILSNWSIEREGEGQETRFLVIRVEPVAPLPLIAGSITPPVPALRPGARAMLGTLGHVVHLHAKNSAGTRATEIRQLLLDGGREELEDNLASGLGGTKVTLKPISWWPSGDLGFLPAGLQEGAAGLTEGEVSPILFSENAHQMVQQLDSRERFGSSTLGQRGGWNPSGFICLLAFGIGAGLLWNGRLGTAAVTMVLAVGAIGFALVQGPDPLTISIQSMPGSNLMPFVLDGSFTLAPFFCGACGITAVFASSFGSSSAPRWALRLSKSMAAMCTGLAAGLTGLYLFFKIWPPVQGMETTDLILLVLVSYWATLVPVSCLGGVVCAGWNSGDKLS